MDYYIIIPAHNEEAYLRDTLHALVHQSLPPKQVVVVNDNSTDGTEEIIDSFSNAKIDIRKLNHSSADIHMPGSKVIQAFNRGLEVLDDAYDFIVKLDADIILPDNYFERIGYIFQGNPKVGIAGGFAYEQVAYNEWKLNHPMNKNHVRGAFKAYSKACFKAIGGLRNAMGWDTVDELLAQYHEFEIVTDDSLQAKHLRATGRAYNPKAKLLQGKAMYAMRYGPWLSGIASLKMAWKQKSHKAFLANMYGFFLAKKERDPFLVSAEEGRFIRKLRWRGIKQKLV